MIVIRLCKGITTIFFACSAQANAELSLGAGRTSSTEKFSVKPFCIRQCIEEVCMDWVGSQMHNTQNLHRKPRPLSSWLSKLEPSSSSLHLPLKIETPNWVYGIFLFGHWYSSVLEKKQHRLLPIYRENKNLQWFSPLAKTLNLNEKVRNHTIEQ